MMRLVIGAESPIQPAKRPRLTDTENRDCLTGSVSSSKNPEDARETVFKKMIFDMAKEMGEDDLKSLKQLCRVYQLIPKGDLEKKKTAHEVFECLREASKISVGNTDMLEKLLEDIKRNDLVEEFVVPFKKRLG
ncbi:caspase-8-like [Saccoglossus kowalevskii]